MRSCASRREIRSFISRIHSVVTSRQPQGVRGRAACDMRLAACGLWLSGRHLLMDERELIYDWNRAGGEGGPAFDWSRVRVDLNDETLRDGLQSPSVRDPALEVKKRLLHLMADLGIVAADIGLPGAGPRVVEQVRALATEIRDAGLPLAPSCGAARICLADTVGHATPDGVKSLVNFVKQEVVKQNRVKVDWHGHRDRGLGLINCLAAIEAGVDRVHGTALGVGERVGNAEMDLLIVNLKLLGAHHHDIAKLPEYCRPVADAVRGGEAHRPRAGGRGVPSAAQAGGMAVAPFRGIERSYFDLRWHLDPVGATQAGVKTYDDRYGRFSPSALAPHLAALKSLAAALEETTAAELDDEIDRTALLNEIRVTLRRFERERPQAKNPGFWLSHLLSGLHFLLGRRDRTPEERAVSLAGRLEDVPRLLDDARAALVGPVRVFVDTALRINEGGLVLVREVGAGLGERVAAAADAAAAAMAAFAHDLERWLEGASDQFALGEEDFNFHLHYEHALRDTAPELWRYGLHLKEELEADLGARAARLDRGKGWQDVAERLRADHPPASALVDAYAGEMARARDFVATRGLAPIPDAPLDVVPTPAFMRPIIPFAAYDRPGAYPPDRTGWFYVTLPDPTLPPSAQERILRDHCRYELGVTALHEAYPGHHLNLVHAQQQPSDTRKVVWTPLRVEGWALYCEDMMGEEGFYQSEEEQFFQRVHLLWRATRILLDVGLHTRGMTFEQAVEHMTTHLRVDRANAEAEVRRYCAEAAQPLCYAVGRREILDLRNDFRAAQGKAFTMRRFHDALLRYGGLPVTLIRWGLGLNEQ